MKKISKGRPLDRIAGTRGGAGPDRPSGAGSGLTRAAATAAAFVAAATAAYAARTEIVVAFGIAAYRAASTLLWSLAALSAAAAAAKAWSAYAARRAEEEAALAKRRERAMEELEKDRAGARLLSFRKDMDPSSVAAALRAEARGEWAAVGGELSLCATGLDELEADRERLRELLSRNDARSLDDSEEALAKAQQAACKNARKALNFLSVLDPDAPEDVEEARGKAAAAARENEKILKKAREFLVALAEFLNGQGDGDADVAALETYERAIREVTESSGRDAKAAAVAAASAASTASAPSPELKF